MPRTEKTLRSVPKLFRNLFWVFTMMKESSGKTFRRKNLAETKIQVKIELAKTKLMLLYRHQFWTCSYVAFWSTHPGDTSVKFYILGGTLLFVRHLRRLARFLLNILFEFFLISKNLQIFEVYTGSNRFWHHRKYGNRKRFKPCENPNYILKKSKTHKSRVRVQIVCPSGVANCEDVIRAQPKTP